MGADDEQARDRLDALEFEPPPEHEAETIRWPAPYLGTPQVFTFEIPVGAESISAQEVADMVNPMTTASDLAVAPHDGATHLPLGQPGQVLRWDGKQGWYWAGGEP